MLKIRRYNDSDKKAVRFLHIEALKSTNAFAKSGQWDSDLNRIREIYLKNGDFIVGILNKKIVAMGAIKKISDNLAEIKRMRVHPKHQRRGFGQLILNDLEKRAIRLGYKTLQLDTTTKQKSAQKFYKKNGYKKLKTGYVGPYKSYFYKKILKA